MTTFRRAIFFPSALFNGRPRRGPDVGPSRLLVGSPSSETSQGPAQKLPPPQSAVVVVLLSACFFFVLGHRFGNAPRQPTCPGRSCDVQSSPAPPPLFFDFFHNRSFLAFLRILPAVPPDQRKCVLTNLLGSCPDAMFALKLHSDLVVY